MSNTKNTTVDERATAEARETRERYEKPEILEQGNLKKITALSFQPPA